MKFILIYSAYMYYILERDVLIYEIFAAKPKDHRNVDLFFKS